MDFSVDPEIVRRDDVGDVFTHIDGHRYKVTKKTRTAIAVTRYYWFDALYDWLVWSAKRFTIWRQK